MNDTLQIIAAFNKIIVGKHLVELLDRDYQNELITDDNNISQKRSQVRVSYRLTQVICFTKKLISCAHYRRRVFNNLKKLTKQNSTIPCQTKEVDGQKDDQNSHSMAIRIVVRLPSMEENLFIDKLWNRCILNLVVVRFQIEESFAWLSTLGGAYSSLGDHNVNCAIKAGQISISQLRLASICGDPNMIARCGIYLVYSLCQQENKKQAIRLVKRTVHPYISRIVNCDKIVKTMYSAVCYRIRHLDIYRMNYQ